MDEVLTIDETGDGQGHPAENVVMENQEWTSQAEDVGDSYELLPLQECKSSTEIQTDGGHHRYLSSYKDLYL